MGKDMRDFLKQVERETPEEFIRVKKEIGLEYETTNLVEKLKKIGKDPVLFFEKVKGFDMPMVSNLMANRARIAMALKVTPENVAKEFRTRQANPIPPVYVKNGPVKEVIVKGNDVDLKMLPVTTHHSSDPGPYLTSSIVIVTDPETGIRNASYGRFQVAGKNKMRTHISPGRHLDAIYKKFEKMNKPMPISIFIGHHPALAMGSLSLVPFHVDELDIMGAMAGEPVELVKGEVVDCEYPAFSEIVIEAEVPPFEREDEGPFAEFTGYATGVRKRPVVYAKAICMRKNPIYYDLIAGNDEHLLPGAISREAYFYSIASSACPSIKDIHVPPSGAGRFHCYVAIEKHNEGQVNNLAMAIFGSDMFVKHIVVVDTDINVYNDAEVLWAIGSRVQADRDINIISNCRGSDLDPSAHFPPEREGITAKVIIDATAKPGLDYEAFSRKNRVPEEIEKKMNLEEYLGKL